MTNAAVTAPPIWDFVLGFYGKEGVSPAAIALQDAVGIDVNMILFLMWMAAQRKSLDAADVAKVSEASLPWQRNVVVPVRGVRRLLKENAPLVAQDAALAYRKKVQAVELEGEQLQLNAMTALAANLRVGAAASAEAAARENLAAFASVVGKTFPVGAVETFVRALKESADGR